MNDALTSRPERELALLTEIEQALRNERQALERQDLVALEAAVAHKNAAFARHAELAGKTGTRALDASPAEPTTPALQQHRDALRELAETCDRLNRENGSLIYRMQERTRQALDILRHSDRSPRLYSGSGSAEQSAGRHSLGKA
ncbi:MAG: flagella synthesis protein FlgN [Chromatocurvus sp.]